jgi:hypothetical protein
MRIVPLIQFAPLTLPTGRRGNGVVARHSTFWARDKIQLKDESLENSANLPDPDVS